MALGKICEWKDPLQILGQDRTQLPPQQAQHAYSPVSMRADLPAHQNVALPNAGFRFGHMSRMPSNEGLSSFEKGPKNADIIPGIAYYAYATEILGTTHGSVKLAYVQANLLAGLYAGQLARVFESWRWIAEACRACQVLIRPCVLMLASWKYITNHLCREKIHMTVSDAYTDLITVTFWTCLELER